MAAEVVPLATLKLPAGPSSITAEQRYWKSFKKQKSHFSTATWPVSCISFPEPSSASATTAAATRQNDLFAVTAGPRVEVFSIRKREPLKTIGRFESVARSGHIRGDSRVLVAGDDSGKMQVFDVAGGARAVILKTWTWHKQPVWVTRWSPWDLTSLMSASDDKTVQLWNLSSDEPVRSFVGHHDYVRAGAFMSGAGANSSMLVTGSYDGKTILWDARAPGPCLTFKHANPVESVLPLASGSTILASAANTISVLDLVAAKPLRLITNHQKTVTSLCVASNGQRVVSGGLDGHVKVFETGSWNVVASMKYPSPILSVSVISTGANADDRHLAVGMQSGVLSIKTRLSGPAAEREKQRQLERSALEAGTIDQFDASQSKRKRRKEMRNRLDLLGEGVDVVIAPGTTKRSKKETKWQKDLRHQRFGAALDAVLDSKAKEYSPLTVLTLLVALRHRSALRDALENRDEVTVQPILKWICSHISDPRYMSSCIDVSLHLLDLYSEYAGGSADLDTGFRLLGKKVKRQVEMAQMASQTGGMLDSLMVGGLA